MPKKSVGFSFSVAFFSGSEKIWMGGEYQDFTSKTLCPTERKNFVEETFTVAFFLGIEKVWIRVGDYQYFPSKFFRSHSAENFRR